MAYMTFQEYLDRNNKLKTKASVAQIADFDGSVDSKPAREKKHKDAGGKGQSGESKPYKGGSDAKDPNKGQMMDGLAHKGDQKMKYMPDTTQGKDHDNIPGGKKAASWPKTETQDWLDRTKGMSLAEFTKTVRESTLKGLDECACQEAPHETIKKIVHVCKCNNNNVSALVREMKRNGLFDNLMSEMANHPEAFHAIASLMEDESNARKFAKALNEMVAPPLGNDSEEKSLMHKKKNLPLTMGDEDMPEDEDMGDEGDMEDEDMPMDDEDGDMEGDEEDMGDEGDMGDEDMEGDDEGMDDEDMGDEDMGDEDMGDEDMEGEDEGMDDEMPMPPKKSAHHNVMNAMKDHPALMGYR